MALSKYKFASASGLTMGIVYVVCRIFVAFSPSAALKLLGWWIHTLNLEQLITAPDSSVSAFIGGLLSAVVLSYIVAWIFAAIYNALVKSDK